MRIGRRRKVAACWLLSVFVPMLLLSALHLHDSTSAYGDSCKECVSHVPHSGHFSSGASGIHDCILCQFFSIPYLCASTVAVPLMLCRKVAAHTQLTASTVESEGGIRLSRAPPVGRKSKDG